MPAWVALAALLMGCGASSGALVGQRILVDPERDDYGPGRYVYPDGGGYRAGALDLREVALSRRGEWVDVAVTFAGTVAMAKGVRLAREQVADLFLATVDLYVVLGAASEQGQSEALPGRNVRLADGARWDLAVVLSPIPARLREALETHAPGASVIIPDRVRVRGKSLRARFPVSALRGQALATLGVAVAVTGTVFGSTFRGAVDGMVPTAFAREVTAKPGHCDRWEEALDGAPCTFGGCTTCVMHTRVIDALHPEPGVQEDALSGQGDESVAVLPINWGPEAMERLMQREGLVREVTVVDQRERLVTVTAGAAGLPDAGVFLEGYDANGAVVATFVMLKVLSKAGAPLGVLEWVSGSQKRVVRLRW